MPTYWEAAQASRSIRSTIFAKNLSNGLKVARYGGGGELTRFVCGYMACDPSLSEVVLAGLPSMFVVNIADDSAGQWLANSIQFSVREAGGPGTGSEVVLAKLSEVLFVETLRRFIKDLPDRAEGMAGRSTRSRDRRNARAAA